MLCRVLSATYHALRRALETEQERAHVEVESILEESTSEARRRCQSASNSTLRDVLGLMQLCLELKLNS